MTLKDVRSNYNENGSAIMTEKRFIEPYEDCRVIKNIQTGETATYYDTEDGLMFLKWLNNLSDENEEFKKALVELKEIGDYQEGRIKELSDENEQLESELKKIVEVCRKYGIYKEELQYVLADYDKMLNENGERAIRYKYCVNSR